MVRSLKRVKAMWEEILLLGRREEGENGLSRRRGVNGNLVTDLYGELHQLE